MEKIGDGLSIDKIENIENENAEKTMKRITNEMFLELVGNKKNMLYKIAFMYVKNENEALDIVNETIYKAYSSIKKIKEPKYFVTYITRILINSSLDFIKKNKKIIYLDEIKDKDEKNYFNDDKLDLYEAVDKLMGLEKTVIILKYFEDMKIKDIAETLKISESKVKNNLHKALNKLRCDLKEGYYNE
ncbi:MAG: sigma-70 family RNA polymerase sigma factor [Clostridiaceae bacterium]